jgi:hypothetical protein
MAWKADLVQGVLFTLPSTPQIDALEAWRSAFGDRQPEAFNRPPNPLQRSQAEGTFASLRLVIGAQLGRVDVSANPPQSTEPMVEPPQIEDVPAAVEEVTRVLTFLCAKSRIVRVGLVGALSQSFKSNDEVVKRLAEETGGVGHRGGFRAGGRIRLLQ